jgi:beta-galactosidase
LYVPAPVLRAGRNEVLLLELHAAVTDVVHLVSEPELGVVAG